MTRRKVPVDGLPQRVNHWYWEDLASLHSDICRSLSDAVAEGASTLRHLELRAIGAPRGLELLHLMCHLGHDSISWSRLGARVTACDASTTALNHASALAHRCGQPVEFRQIRLPDLPDAWNDRFDAVVLTYGVLEWIPDLERWAAACARCLSAGGRLIVIDDHPDASRLRIVDGIVSLTDPPEPGPIPHRTSGSYLDRGAIVRTPLHYRWRHTADGIRRAIVEAGLIVTRTVEHPFTHYPRFPGLFVRPDGYYDPGDPPSIPLLIEIVAQRPIDG